MTRDELEELHRVSDRSLIDKHIARKRWVTLEEAHLLADIVEEEAPDHIFESGTANGYSAAWLGLSGVPVTTYDPCPRVKVWGTTAPAHITYVQDKFSSMVEAAKAVEGKKLFFIDGNHRSSGVSEDVTAIREVIKPGDVIVFHDLNSAKVVRFWHRLQEFAETWERYETQRIMGKLIWRGE